MSFISNIFHRRNGPNSAQDRLAGSGYRFFFGTSAAGKVVNEQSAMQMSAVFACVRVLAESVACLPLHVYTSQFVPALAADKPVLAFGDFSYYNIGDRGPRSFARLNELFAVNGQVGFVSKERVDGKLVLPEAVQILRTGANG